MRQGVDEPLHEDVAELLVTATHGVGVHGNDGGAGSGQVAEGLSLRGGVLGSAHLAARGQREGGFVAGRGGGKVAVLLGRQAREVAKGNGIIDNDLEGLASSELGQSLQREHDGLGAGEVACVDLHGDSNLFAGGAPRLVPGRRRALTT